jgi:hypothetical protein
VGRRRDLNDAAALRSELAEFSAFGTKTETTELGDVPVYVNEFWTSRQRQASSLHEVSYRACFKPQLPRFFIERLSAPGDLIHDPFMGRGTTELEAALLGRAAAGADINPLSELLLQPRLRPPRIEQVKARLEELDLNYKGTLPKDFGVFFSRKTLKEICALRDYLLDRELDGSIDEVDRFIRMVAINRLTGHSPGFFSVYTLPPNQAASIASQRRINAKRGQRPSYRDVRALILRKSRALLKGLSESERERLEGLPEPQLLVANAWRTPELRSGSVALTVTSPPFLDIVNYKTDNWLRCWFAGIDAGAVHLSQLRNLESWRLMVHETLAEQHRLLRPGGFIAFEVGEVRKGTVRLEEEVLEAAEGTGLEPVCVMINMQKFTKTSHLWGIANASGGTNSNRIVVLQRP